jgi:hypothetical protein
VNVPLAPLVPAKAGTQGYTETPALVS